jgi:hypothetical protein
MISGTNPVTKIISEEDYFFSRFFHIWGWATWKRAWDKFDIDIRVGLNTKNKMFWVISFLIIKIIKFLLNKCLMMLMETIRVVFGHYNGRIRVWLIKV